MSFGQMNGQTMLQALQAHCAGADRAAADASLLEALEAGLPWDAVTQAAARGSAERFAAERFARHAVEQTPVRPSELAPRLEPGSAPLPG